MDKKEFFTVLLAVVAAELIVAYLSKSGGILSGMGRRGGSAAASSVGGTAGNTFTNSAQGNNITNYGTVQGQGVDNPPPAQ